MAEDKNTASPTGHPWSDFLHYRHIVILWLLSEKGESFESVARTLSMDPDQVRLISMAPVKSRPSPPVAREATKE